MSWIFVALVGYFFNALAALFDKFLLSENRIGSPALYAFYTSLMSAFAIVLVPFGFVFAIPLAMSVAFCSGVLFLLGLLAFYEAIHRSEVTRAATLVGAAVVGFLFLASFAAQSSGERFALLDVFALGLLVSGSLLLARRREDARFDMQFIRLVVVSGALMALSLLLLKESYQLSNFASGFVWSRMGMFVCGLGILLVPNIRRHIFSRFERANVSRKRSISTGGYFLLNKIFGGAGAFLISYAVSLGPVTFVQGLNGAQFAFLFLLAAPLSLRYPHIFKESRSWREWAGKIVAIALIGCGIFLAAMSGNLKGFL